MKRAIILSFLACAIVAPVSCIHKNSLDKVSADVISSEFIYEAASFPSCHASTVLETKDGLLAAWFGGSYESNPDVCIYCSSYDGSLWSEPVMAADGVVSDTLRYPCWNPVLHRLDDGSIVLFYKVGPNPREWWGEYRISSDEGRTWGEPVPLPEGMLGPIKNKPLPLPDGTILYPTSVEYTPDRWRVFVESSRNDLSGWVRIPVDNNGFNAIQPTFFFHGGRLEMLCRTQEGVLARSLSADLGATWSPLEDSGLQNNNSGIDGIVLKNGLRLLVCNPQQEGRNKLALMGSFDGAEWRTLLMLEDQLAGEFSYPAIILRGNDRIDITYTYNREKIKHVSLSVSFCNPSHSRKLF